LQFSKQNCRIRSKKINNGFIGFYRPAIVYIMATINAVIIPSQKKKDGTWNVKIRVNKDGRSTYIETSHFVNSKQVWKKNQIKDPKLLAILGPLLTEYRLKIGELGTKLTSLTSSKLAVNLFEEGIKAEDINVVEFGRRRIDELKKANRSGSAKNMQSAINGLIDFFRTEDIRITDIRANMLQRYEEFLLNPRTQTRPDQFHRLRTREIAGSLSALSYEYRHFRPTGIPC
jgi:hypothetical protein